MIAESERIMRERRSRTAAASGEIYGAHRRACPRCGDRVCSRGQGDGEPDRLLVPALSGARPAARRRYCGSMAATAIRRAAARGTLFSELSAAELERIGSRRDSALVPEGRPRLSRGRPERRLLHRPQRRAAGHPRALRRPRDRPGDARHRRIFGELAMLDGGARSASVEALSDAELLALPALRRPPACSPSTATSR